MRSAKNTGRIIGALLLVQFVALTLGFILLLPVTASDLRFLVDTGADPSAVDLATAQRLGWPVDMSIAGEASGVGQRSTKIYPATIPTLLLGSAKLGPIEALAVDLSALSRRLGVDVAGVLGYSFLQERIVQIDYPRRLFRILADRPGYAADALRLPLRKLADDDATPLVTTGVVVNGNNLPVSLDTGSSLTLDLFPSASALLGPDLWKDSARETEVLGARGEVTVREVYVESVSVGPWNLGRQEIVLSEWSASESGRVGNLGNGILKHFVLTLDYKNGEVVFERPSNKAIERTGTAGRSSPTR